MGISPNPYPRRGFVRDPGGWLSEIIVRFPRVTQGLAQLVSERAAKHDGDRRMSTDRPFSGQPIWEHELEGYDLGVVSFSCRISAWLQIQSSV
jgi:hypothetical protein